MMLFKHLNVTIVSKTKDLPYENETFDTIISTECFEHDPTYKESFLKIYAMLKKDGLFCLLVLRLEEVNTVREGLHQEILMVQ